MALSFSPDRAAASGPAGAAPWYLDQFGGDQSDLDQVYLGHLGVIMARSPRSILYLDWRILHGQAVGPEVGHGLSAPCCDRRWVENAPPRGVEIWQPARLKVEGVVELSPPWINTSRTGLDFTSTPNCFDDAFETAAATLSDRITRFGAGSPHVKAWLAAQDNVFQGCSAADVRLPDLPAAAPTWLRADRAYQAAALALYQARYPDAVRQFEAIGRDPSSSWRGCAPYLRARALLREALSRPSPGAFADAHHAVDALAALPATTFGHAKVDDMRHMLMFRENPQALMAEVTRKLAGPTADASTATTFHDLTDLADQLHINSDIIDWMTTLRASPSDAALMKAYGVKDKPDEAVSALQAATVKGASNHAWNRWLASHDTAWLVAALGLADRDDANTHALVAAAMQIPEKNPAWLTLQFHVVRLTLASSPVSENRERLDRLIARQDLSVSDRNLFLSQRMQLASDIDDFIRLSLRRRLCNPDNPPGACVRNNWPLSTVQYGGVFDGVGQHGVTGLGEDARALIDRMPLAMRRKLATDDRFPAAIRLDIALTSFARAVDLQDAPAIDALAMELVKLLPILSVDFRSVIAAAQGPDKRFAEFLVLAKLPGLKEDLINSVRPEGATIAEFQGEWADWLIRSNGAPGMTPPQLAVYQDAGAGVERTSPDALTDLTCLGECGRGAAPLRVPDFAASSLAQANRERSFFNAPRSRDRETGDLIPLQMDAGAVSAWNEMLSWINAHATDPRAPEALYWLVHVGHFGGSHDHSGRRAFKLLKSRYPNSEWAKKVKYYYD